MNIHQENISLFIDLLKDKFKNLNIDSKSLVPDTIYDLANTSSEWSRIPNWDLFEVGEHEYTDDEEERLFLNGLKEGRVVLISDVSLMNKQCLLFDLHEFELFKEEYEELYQCEFFEPEDYILYFIEENSFRLIHHSGYSTYFKLES